MAEALANDHVDAAGKIALPELDPVRLPLERLKQRLPESVCILPIAIPCAFQGPEFLRHDVSGVAASSHLWKHLYEELQGRYPQGVGVELRPVLHQQLRVFDNLRPAGGKDEPGGHRPISAVANNRHLGGHHWPLLGISSQAEVDESELWSRHASCSANQYVVGVHVAMQGAR